MLLLRLLKDGARRAASAACASAIWHPTFAYRVTGNIGSERINMAFEAVKMALRNASSSTPHIHVMVGDREVCHLGVPASLHKPGDVVLTHWGNEDCFVPAVNYAVLPPGSGFSKRALGPKRRPAQWDVRDEALVAAAIAAYGTPGAALLQAHHASEPSSSVARRASALASTFPKADATSPPPKDRAAAGKSTRWASGRRSRS